MALKTTRKYTAQCGLSMYGNRLCPGALQRGGCLHICCMKTATRWVKTKSHTLEHSMASNLFITKSECSEMQKNKALTGHGLLL